jgi:glycosyltransferase involved in cell wall biosynthesis
MAPFAQLSIVIPVRNELESIGPLLEELRAALPRTGRDYEIVLVDDASTDGSADRIREEARRDPRVRSLALERWSGQSSAVAAGIARARGEVIVTLDADLQYDPTDLPRLLDALENADVVSGIRRRRQDSWLRRLSSRVGNSARRIVLGDPVTDIGCSFKAYRREALEGLPLFAGAHRFLPALCVFRGARLIEVPITHRPRRFGVSKYGVSNRLWPGLIDLWGVRWLRSRMLRHRIREEP